MSVKDKWVRRFSIDETSKHKNGFTIYKITSVLFPLESPEAVTVVSVWKRYSDIQQLHKSMKSLHAGLHLRGTFPSLAKSSYFKRFQQEVIEERAKTIKELLEFIAEHRLLFTSTDFVHFLQEGYPEPDSKTGVINAIRSSLHLPIEETPPLEYQSDEDSSINVQSAHETTERPDLTRSDFDISQIPIYEGTEVEVRQSSTRSTGSFESITSLESLDSDLFDELSRVHVQTRPCVRRNLPDLIDFEGGGARERVGEGSVVRDGSVVDGVARDGSVEGAVTREGRSAGGVVGEEGAGYVREEGAGYVREEDAGYVREEGAGYVREGVGNVREEGAGYVREAGSLLRLAARCEAAGDRRRAFEFYKSAIEKMLQGVQTDLDPERRALVKQRTSQYLAYAERIYRDHLRDEPAPASCPRAQLPPPAGMLARGAESLGAYRVLGLLGPRAMLVLDQPQHKYYAMKVIQKIPRNLTELDGHSADDTREPVLPTLAPYTVPLHALVRTDDLIFLVMAYAPGGLLTDYIRAYVRARTAPHTTTTTLETPARQPCLAKITRQPNTEIPTRQSNLESNTSQPNIENTTRQPTFENITRQPTFENITRQPNTENSIRQPDTENITKTSDEQNNIEANIDTVDAKIDTSVDANENVMSDEVSELVLNSQRLLLNVDKALSDNVNKDEVLPNKTYEDGDFKQDSRESGFQTRSSARAARAVRARDVLPPLALQRWGAQLLTAIDSLHNCGVCCRDLHAGNVLLGAQGQVLLTYFPGHPPDVARALLRRRWPARAPHVAPELWAPPALGPAHDRCADYWSYGVLMYELLCGEALSAADVRWSHSGLPLPAGLSLEERSLLTQLITHEPAERLGAGGAGEVRAHPYFRGVDWQAVADDWSLPD